MEMNEQLKLLYASKWEAVCNAFQPKTTTRPAYPFLLSTTRWENDQPGERWYTDADLRVMVFGQETNGWTGGCDDFGTPPLPVFNPDVTMEAVMGIYENFYATYYHSTGFTYNGTRYGSFHHGFNRFVTLMNASLSGKRIAYLWNNIVKFGKAEGTGFCGEEIYDVQRQHFMVMAKEVEILKPNLILFLTGSYDNRICDCWNGATFVPLSPFTTTEIAKVILPGVDIPAYRTNHPSARLSKEEKEARLEAIVNDFIETI
ncbi:MAG: hypothetical protein NC410_11670 [Oscillibacter sp.]|nr:hypothetical protein [Oscillibacter sp.]